MSWGFTFPVARFFAASKSIKRHAACVFLPLLLQFAQLFENAAIGDR